MKILGAAVTNRPAHVSTGRGGMTMNRRSIQKNNRKFQSAQKGIGECPTCGRGRALVSVTPRPTQPGEVTTYCRWDDCDYTRVRPQPTDPHTSHGGGSIGA